MSSQIFRRDHVTAPSVPGQNQSQLHFSSASLCSQPSSSYSSAAAAAAQGNFGSQSMLALPRRGGPTAAPTSASVASVYRASSIGPPAAASALASSSGLPASIASSSSSSSFATKQALATMSTKLDSTCDALESFRRQMLERAAILLPPTSMQPTHHHQGVDEGPPLVERLHNASIRTQTHEASVLASMSKIQEVLERLANDSTSPATSRSESSASTPDPSSAETSGAALHSVMPHPTRNGGTLNNTLGSFHVMPACGRPSVPQKRPR